MFVVVIQNRQQMQQVEELKEKWLLILQQVSMSDDIYYLHHNFPIKLAQSFIETKTILTVLIKLKQENGKPFENQRSYILFL